MLFAFLSGVGYLGLQALYLEKMVLLCDRPVTALAIHFYLLFVTILVGSYIVEARPSNNPERWLRSTGFVIVLSHGAAFMALTLWKPLTPGPLAVWLAGVILTFPAIASGVAFGKFVQIVLKNYPQTTFGVLFAIACGAFVSAPRMKLLVMILGSPIAFTILLLGFVAILTVLPATPSDDRHPTTW